MTSLENMMVVEAVEGRVILMPSRGNRPVPATPTIVPRNQLYITAVAHGDLTELDADEAQKVLDDLAPVADTVKDEAAAVQLAADAADEKAEALKTAAEKAADDEKAAQTDAEKAAAAVATARAKDIAEKAATTAGVLKDASKTAGEDMKGHGAASRPVPKLS